MLLGNKKDLEAGKRNRYSEFKVLVMKLRRVMLVGMERKPSRPTVKITVLEAQGCHRQRTHLITNWKDWETKELVALELVTSVDLSLSSFVF